jgi:transposase
MRPVAIDRKNWIHVGSEQAGPRVAAIISIVETCRRQQIPVREYLSAVLPGLENFPANRVNELTPAAWFARNSQPSKPRAGTTGRHPPRRPCG